MKIGRTIGIGLSLLLLVTVAAVLYLLSSLNAIVAGAIQKYGSQVTQTPVRVTSVSIDLKSGAGSIQQLTVGNPDGFSAPHIFTLDGIHTRLDLASLGEDPIVIEEIHVDSPAVVYEINATGQSNIQELQHNISESGSGAQSAESSGGAEGPRLIIRKLVVEGGMIDARVAAMGEKPMSAKLPRIQLNNIGEQSGGATGAEVAEQILRAIIARVGPAVARLGLEKYMGKDLEEAQSLLGERLGDRVGDSPGKDVKEGGGLRELLGK